MSDDIPSLTLRVLESIQTELVGLRGDVQEVKVEIVEIKGDIREMKGEIVEMKGEIVEMKGEIVEMKGELKVINSRFDHFLSFAGRDVQDLKSRMTVVEEHLGLARKQ